MQKYYLLFKDDTFAVRTAAFYTKLNFIRGQCVKAEIHEKPLCGWLW